MANLLHPRHSEAAAPANDALAERPNPVRWIGRHKLATAGAVVMSAAAASASALLLPLHAAAKMPERPLPAHGFRLASAGDMCGLISLKTLAPVITPDMQKDKSWIDKWQGGPFTCMTSQDLPSGVVFSAEWPLDDEYMVIAVQHDKQASQYSSGQYQQELESDARVQQAVAPWWLRSYGQQAQAYQKVEDAKITTPEGYTFAAALGVTSVEGFVPAETAEPAIFMRIPSSDPGNPYDLVVSISKALSAQRVNGRLPVAYTSPTDPSLQAAAANIADALFVPAV